MHNIGIAFLIAILALTATTLVRGRATAEAVPDSSVFDNRPAERQVRLQEDEEAAESDPIVFLLILPFIFGVPLAVWSYMKRGVVRQLVDEQGLLRAGLIAAGGIGPALAVILGLGLAMGLGGGTPEENKNDGVDIVFVLGVGGVVGTFCGVAVWQLMPKGSQQGDSLGVEEPPDVGRDPSDTGMS